MKGTQLWQEAGSPIIHGRSRRLRPFWQTWGLSAILSAILLAAAEWWVRGGSAGATTQGVSTGLVLGLPGAILGSASATWIARSASWRWPWAYGLLGGVALGLLSVWLLGGVVKI